jgi:hypothetical protein
MVARLTPIAYIKFDDMIELNKNNWTVRCRIFGAPWNNGGLLATMFSYPHIRILH